MNISKPRVMRDARILDFTMRASIKALPGSLPLKVQTLPSHREKFMVGEFAAKRVDPEGSRRKHDAFANMIARELHDWRDLALLWKEMTDESEWSFLFSAHDATESSPEP